MTEKEHELERLVERTIRAWAKSQTAERHMNEYRSERRPETPVQLDSVADLLEYKEKADEYENEMKTHNKEFVEADREFRKEEAKLMPYLPEGVPFFHTYRPYGGPEVNRTFQIIKSGSNEISALQIQEMDD